MNEATKAIQIQELRIWKKASYEDINPDRWVAKVAYQQRDSSMEIALAPEIAERMLTFLAPALVEFSRQAVGQIAQDITTQVQAIGVQPIEAPALMERTETK